MRPSLRVKQSVRAITRSIGYEVTPFRQGFRALQSQMLARSEVVIDVGANVGQFAQLTRALGYQGRIVSFEPQSGAFTRLKKNALEDASWECRNVAVSNEPGRRQLLISENSVSSSLLSVLNEHVAAAPGSRAVATEDVRVTTLEREFTSLPDDSRAFLKIDTQGNELLVLQGAGPTLSRCPVVQLELSFVPLYEGQGSWLQICSFMESHGYYVRHLEPGFEDPTSGYLQQADVMFVRAGGVADQVR